MFNVTGQVILRDSSHEIDIAGVNLSQDSLGEGRKLMTVVGIVAVPKDQFKGEHQYSVLAMQKDGPWMICEDTAIDLTKEIAGLSADGMLKSQIWRV